VSERAAGWYPDPWTDGQHRFWTGTSWTADVFPASVMPTAPVLPTAPVMPTALGPPTAPGPPAETAPSSWSRPRDVAGAPPTAPSDVPPDPPKWGPPQTASALDVVGQEPWTLVTPASTGRRPRGATFLALMLIAGLVLGFLGVFGVQTLLDQRSAARTPDSAAAAPSGATILPPSAPPSTTPSAPPTTPPADPAASVLPGLVVRQIDVGSTVTIAQLRNGAEVYGTTTLDLCNGTFASEILRTARLQVAASDDLGRTHLSTEAVAYGTPSATAQAFRELKSVAAKCPGRPVTSPVGEPTVTTTFARAPDAAWPHTAGVDRQAYRFTSTDATGDTAPSIAVYLKRGRILLGVYFPHPDGKQSPVAGQSTVAGIVKVFADRLARVPRSVTG